MKKRVMLLTVAMMIIALSACGKEDSRNITGDENNPTTSIDIDESKAEELSEAELNEIQEKLNTNEYNGFVNQGFSSPNEIDWTKVFYNGAGISSSEISDKEEQTLLDELNWYELYGDVIVLSKKDIEDFVLKHTGLDTEAKDLNLDAIYLEEYENFYFVHSDADFTSVSCLSGIKAGDVYEVLIKTDEEIQGSSAYLDPVRTISFTDKNGVYEIYSDIYDWESGSDPEQSFDIDMGLGGKAQLYTYQDDMGDGACITIVRNGNALYSTVTEDAYSDDYWVMHTVKAIGFVDYNLDGYQDMIIIGETDSSEKILTYTYQPDSDFYIYQQDDEIGNYVSNSISDYTIADVKKCLMGDYETSSKDCNASYQQVVRICDILNSSYDIELSFDLIDVDGDTTLELVVDRVGYGVSLYTYDGEKVVCLMNDWGYGAFGNAGYEYAPGLNCITNFNADYAGLIGKEYYMSIDDDTIVTEYYSIIYNFDDQNGNGVPDNGEDDSDKLENAVGSIKYFSNNESLSEDEIKARIEKLAGYPYQGLIGTKSYEDIMKSLSL